MRHLPTIKRGDVRSLMRTVGRAADRNSPTILTAISAVSVLATVFFTYRATRRSVDKIHDAEIEKGAELTKKEKAKIIAVESIPAAVAVVTAIGTGVASNRINTGRVAGAMLTADMFKSKYEDVKGALVDKVGEKKADELEKTKEADRVVEKAFKENLTESAYYPTIGGTVKCFETMGGLRFLCDADTLRKIETYINRDTNRQDYTELNDFYRELGNSNIPRTDAGSEIIWTADRPFRMVITSRVMNDEPVLVVSSDYTTKTAYNYNYR